MADKCITRGTDAAIVLNFDNNPFCNAEDVTALYFSTKQRVYKREYELSNFTRDGNKLRFDWTQEETLKMTAGERLKLQLDIVANGKCKRVSTMPKYFDVEASERNEVLE